MACTGRAARGTAPWPACFAGFAVWAYTLLLPSFAKSGWLPDGFLQNGLFGIALLRPTQLFGLVGMDEITHCLFWSLLANIATYAGVSLSGRPDAAETSQATLFVDAMKQGTQGTGSRFWRGSARVDELLPPDQPVSRPATGAAGFRELRRANAAERAWRICRPMPAPCTTPKRYSPAPSARPRRE